MVGLKSKFGEKIDFFKSVFTILAVSVSFVTNLMKLASQLMDESNTSIMDKDNILILLISIAMFLSFLILIFKFKKELGRWGCTFKYDAWYSNDIKDVPYAKMRVVSIQRILENVWIDSPSLIKKTFDFFNKIKTDPSKLPKSSNFSQKLEEIGKKIGENVWDDLRILLNELKYEDRINPTKCIEKWLEKEESSGWGYFKYHDTGNIQSDRIARNGCIVVRNCFLSYCRGSNDKKLCPFLCGYMEEIITKIYGNDAVTVTANSDCNCMHDAENRGRICGFTVKPK